MDEERFTRLENDFDKQFEHHKRKLEVLHDLLFNSGKGLMFKVDRLERHVENTDLNVANNGKKIDDIHTILENKPKNNRETWLIISNIITTGISILAMIKAFM